ncbi:hypothetical protein FRB94_012283 [Tulasnella sp. JGI-2019a]|nr:hypothetical protein FRB94_012283 [Tulasnella sp. JGI-2019a]
MNPSHPCLDSGDETKINEILKNGGEGQRVNLCQGSVFRLQRDPIVFTAASQEIYSEGYAGGRHRAMLIVEGANLTTAIKGDCEDCNGIAIRNLIIDGNRPALLRVRKGTALVEIGNAANQVVQGCRIYDPRAWSALHVREGDRLQCSGALIENNDIGPCGEEWDETYDGLQYGTPRWGQPWADGISLACKSSIVRKNIIHDATDGAIVIFGSAGSRISNNTIYSRTLRVTGGINLVDFPPWDGDYTDTIVEDNLIEAIGSFISVGIAIGPATWTSDIDSIARGAIVRHNVLRGPNFGYGIVVSSVKNFTVMGNAVDMGASRFSGTYATRCPKLPMSAPPMPFLIHRGSSEGVFQDEFKNGEVLYIVCIEPPVLPDLGPAPPRRLRDGSEYLAFKSTEESHRLATTEKSISESLMLSQLRVIRQLEELAREVEGRYSDQGQHRITDFGNPQEALLFRFDEMEHSQKQIKERLQGLKGLLESMMAMPVTPSAQLSKLQLLSSDHWSSWTLAALLGVLVVIVWRSRWKGRFGVTLSQ